MTPGLVPPFRTYREYFASEETNPFTDNFAAVMAPYALDPANAAAAHEPSALARQVYSRSTVGLSVNNFFSFLSVCPSTVKKKINKQS